MLVVVPDRCGCPVHVLHPGDGSGRYLAAFLHNLPEGAYCRPDQTSCRRWGRTLLAMPTAHCPLPTLLPAKGRIPIALAVLFVGSKTLVNRPPMPSPTYDYTPLTTPTPCPRPPMTTPQGITPRTLSLI